MNYNLLIKNLQPEVAKLEKMLGATTYSDSSRLLSEIASHIISSGGKRLRPLILLLAAKMFGYEDVNGDANNIRLAAAIELIHTATLLHDDIIDNSSLRRNTISAHLKWGVRNSIIAGDWLFALAFDLVVSTKNIKIIKIVSNMTKVLARGELDQLHNKNHSIVTEAEYFKVIAAKTAVLFEATMQLAALVAGQPDDTVTNAGLFGLHLGLVFQIQDDLLDYLGASEVIGKNIGDDLQEGKFTLPLIYLKDRDYSRFKKIAKLISNHQLTNNDIFELRQVLVDLKVIDDVYSKMANHQGLAMDYLNKLPDNDYKYTLRELSTQMAVRAC
jgi:octaprenyl-diphosphate synthase